ncbi:RDD family protein [Pilimelia columellifera]|uniref:RDD family protein n=1 Tax=Pilimelia columellifera subsp. columellifera TaxID=706583 RepID=A0ABN3NGZ6_9ACTN
MAQLPPGWYKDPADPAAQRYWDGEGWLGGSLPADAVPPAGPTPQPPEQASPPAHQPVPAPPPVHGPPPAYEQPAGYGPPAQHGPPLRYGPPGAYPPHPRFGLPPAPLVHGHALATPGARLVARLIDIAAILGLNLVVNGYFVWRYVQEVSPALAELWRRSRELDQTDEPLPAAPNAQLYMMIILLVAAALWLAYEVPALANTGQTPGKRAVGIRVVRLETPGPLGFGRALRRWNTLGLPTLLWGCCGIGLVMQVIDCAALLFNRPLGLALHDRSAGTVVVAGSSDPFHPAGVDAGPHNPGGTR